MVKTILLSKIENRKKLELCATVQYPLYNSTTTNNINHKYYNFLESDWSINPPIRALIGRLHVIGHLQSEIVILMINW